MSLPTRKILAVAVLFATASSSFSAPNECTATSGSKLTPVLELFTSEGCSSCPPADQWASSLKDKNVVVQAFHVGYWDYIGWVDRFAAPAYTQRQREIAARNRLRSIYTPQVVLNGQDWAGWSRSAVPSASEPARASITLRQRGPDQFEASVTPLATGQSQPLPASWSAYWTVTEHGHNSKVQAGENAGEFLKHDFVVRQYTQAGDYKTGDAGAQKLTFRSIAPTPGHARQVNLVVYDPQTGRTLQALSLQCTV
jgi:hypothetical protein